MMILALILRSSRALHPVWCDVSAACLVAEAVASARPTLPKRKFQLRSRSLRADTFSALNGISAEFDDAKRLEALVGVSLKRRRHGPRGRRTGGKSRGHQSQRATGTCPVAR